MTYNAEESYRIHLVLPKKTHAELKALAERRHLSFSALCRQALMNLVDEADA